MSVSLWFFLIISKLSLLFYNITLCRLFKQKLYRKINLIFFPYTFQFCVLIPMGKVWCSCIFKNTSTKLQRFRASAVTIISFKIVHASGELKPHLFLHACYNMTIESLYMWHILKKAETLITWPLPPFSKQWLVDASVISVNVLIFIAQLPFHSSASLIFPCDVPNFITEIFLKCRQPEWL